MSLKELPTYRNEKDETGLPIAKVGIREVRAPIRLITKDGREAKMVGNWSIYSDLSASLKGISMSLMQRALFDSLKEKTVSTNTLIEIATKIYEEAEHQCKDVYVKVNFPYWIKVTSPKSEYEGGYKVYDCCFEVRKNNDKIRKYLTVEVQYIATCPCSLTLAKVLKEENGQESGGHQQRAFAKVTIEYNDFIFIEDLIAEIELAVKALPYPIIRKPDEQFICYTARQNPLFVEEAARIIALQLNKNNKILDFTCVCNHEESIHQSNAVAVIRKGIEGGLL